MLLWTTRWLFQGAFRTSSRLTEDRERSPCAKAAGSAQLRPQPLSSLSCPSSSRGRNGHGKLSMELHESWAPRSLQPKRGGMWVASLYWTAPGDPLVQPRKTGSWRRGWHPRGAVHRAGTRPQPPGSSSKIAHPCCPPDLMPCEGVMNSEGLSDNHPDNIPDTH